MFDEMFTNLHEYLPTEHQRLLSFAPDVQAAFKRLQATFPSD
jgi:hypothetical protein